MDDEHHAVRVRGRSYAADRPVPVPAPPVPRERGSRWARSPVTFGPVGRVACTLALASPTAVFLLTGDVTVLFATIGSWAVAPWVLRDAWQRAAVSRRPPGR